MLKIIEDIIHDKRHDILTLPLRTVLRILEFVFSTVVSIRNFLYDKNILKSKDVPCRVIGVGNVTVGGTGKTPVVILTARMLRDAGYPVAVVSRGYRGTSKNTAIVSDGSDIKELPEVTGDEPQIIADALPGVPVVIGRNRYQAAQLAFERFRPKVIVLDDGFQHRKLYRNADIVTVDAENPFGNDHLLPRGILRESPYGLKRAKAVIVTRCENINRDKIERMIRYYNRRIPIFRSRYMPTGLRKPGSGEILRVERLNGRKVAAISNIAGPEQYHRLLESTGADIVLKRVMPDHYRYSREEVAAIESDALNAGAEAVVMTAKDERNLPSDIGEGKIERLVLDIEAVLIDDREAFFDIIKPYS